ncbi:hypothetical protein D3C77_154670 [compost metagenome]
MVSLVNQSHRLIHIRFQGNLEPTGIKHQDVIFLHSAVQLLAAQVPGIDTGYLGVGIQIKDIRALSPLGRPQGLRAKIEQIALIPLSCGYIVRMLVSHLHPDLIAIIWQLGFLTCHRAIHHLLLQRIAEVLPCPQGAVGNLIITLAIVEVAITILGEQVGKIVPGFFPIAVQRVAQRRCRAHRSLLRPGLFQGIGLDTYPGGKELRNLIYSTGEVLTILTELQRALNHAVDNETRNSNRHANRTGRCRQRAQNRSCHRTAERCGNRDPCQCQAHSGCHRSDHGVGHQVFVLVTPSVAIARPERLPLQADRGKSHRRQRRVEYPGLDHSGRLGG